MSALARLQPLVQRVAVSIACEDDVRAFVQRCVPELRDVSPADVNVSFLAGGLTNVLYRASHAPTKVDTVVRRFGEGTDAFIDRDAEEYWIAAYMRVYGRCENGLAYEFLTGFAPPTLEDYFARRNDIAVRLADFHHRGAVWGRCTPRFANMPNSAMTTFLGLFVEQAVGVTKDLGRIPEAQHASTLQLIADLVEAAARVKKDIATFEHHLVVGPCHNDANCPNSLVNSETGDIRFIDFEYMQPSYILADLGNTMCEFAGYDAEWERMPSFEQKQEFLRHYYTESARLTMGDGAVVEGSFEAEVAMMNLLEAVSNIGWSAWAVKQAAVSTIDYDYVAYATRRYARYTDMIDQWEADVKRCVPDLRAP